MNPARALVNDPIWKYAHHEIYVHQAQLEDSKAALTSRQLERYVLHRGSLGGKNIALTFDDGPHPNATPQLLALLKEANVKATFFVIGHMAERYPDLVRQIAKAGHEVGNHTYSHATMTNLSPQDMATEYKANNIIIRKLTGKPARYCRPPGGDFNVDVLKAAASLHLTTVLWTDDPGDYTNMANDVLFRRELDRLSDGGIILLHDGCKNTLETLPAFVAEARKRGYRFVSLDALRRG